MVFFLALAAFAIFPAALAQGLTVNTPQGVVQCQPIKITWSSGSQPYFLSLIPAGQTSAPAIKQFPTQTGNSYTWTADLHSGSSFTVSLRDGTGTQAYSDIVTIQSGSDSSCINTSVTEGATDGSAAPTSGGSGSPSAPSITTTGASSAHSSGSTAASSTAPGSAPSGSSPASTKPTSASGSTASSTTSPKNAASNTKGNAFAMAGMMGLLGAVLF